MSWSWSLSLSWSWSWSLSWSLSWSWSWSGSLLGAGLDGSQRFVFVFVFSLLRLPLVFVVTGTTSSLRLTDVQLFRQCLVLLLLLLLFALTRQDAVQFRKRSSTSLHFLGGLTRSASRRPAAGLRLLFLFLFFLLLFFLVSLFFPHPGVFVGLLFLLRLGFFRSGAPARCDDRRDAPFGQHLCS